MDYFTVITFIVNYTLSSFIYIFILLILFLFIFAKFGQIIFKNKNEDSTIFQQKHSFETLPSAFMACFDIITLNDWFVSLF